MYHGGIPIQGFLEFVVVRVRAAPARRPGPEHSSVRAGEVIYDIYDHPATHRVKRVGIVNAWADPNFSGALKRKAAKILMQGVTTDICLIVSQCQRL